MTHVRVEDLVLLGKVKQLETRVRDLERLELRARTTANAWRSVMLAEGDAEFAASHADLFNSLDTLCDHLGVRRE